METRKDTMFPWLGNTKVHNVKIKKLMKCNENIELLEGCGGSTPAHIHSISSI